MARGFSLHIGINKLSLGFYRCEGALASPANDAEVMAVIARAEGYNKAELLLNQQATAKEFITKLDSYAAILEERDTLLITYSGHGGQVDDENGDEEDKRDETWCFYDSCLVDDELSGRWKHFKKGVRIVVVSSSCHSRTSLRPHGVDYFSKSYRGPSNEAKRNGKFDVTTHVADPEINAAIVHISACEDFQEARDGNQLSLFTSLLVNQWDHGNFSGTYEDLVRQIRKESGYTQRPGIVTYGDNSKDLLNSTPFKLLTNKI
jgi:metacaspase-1